MNPSTLMSATLVDYVLTDSTIYDR